MFLGHYTGTIFVFLLERENAVEMLKSLMGPTDPIEAMTVAPESIRALYGTDIIKNAIHGCDSLELVDDEIAFFFDETAYSPGIASIAGSADS